MPEKKQPKLMLTGKVATSAEVDFAKEEYYVIATSAGKTLAQGIISKDGSYTLNFPSTKAESTDQVELKMLPKSLLSASERITTVEKRISLKDIFENTLQASINLQIPPDLFTLFRRVTKRYHMHGTVYDTVFTDIGGTPTIVSVNPLPAIKIEFYEVDPPLPFPSRFPLNRKQLLGITFSKPDGSYEFDFDFTYYSRHTPIPLFRPIDKVPDIQASFYQYVLGAWVLIHVDRVDWNITESFHRDYFIPHDKVHQTPSDGGRPQTGFRYIRLGLIPIDNTRFVKGYVSTQATDPVPGIYEQPLCGVLRVFGLFAFGSGVAKYKVQIAVADENGAVGPWTDIYDPLCNLKWNNGTNSWNAQTLGPAPDTGLYTNIDTQPEIDWNEHALKFTWNSANYPNGYYALRIIGYDNNQVELGTYEMPVIRVDNTVPEIYLEAVSALGDITDCGCLRIDPTNRHIRFRITAYDPSGHVLQYTLSGSRGKNSESCGAPITETRPAGTPHWVGVADKYIDFAITQPSLTCSAMAYHFVLEVWGSATNGYASRLLSQYTTRSTNLVVTEL